MNVGDARARAVISVGSVDSVGTVTSRGPAHTALRAALLAFVYFGVGRLSLLLAIPPGYATAVWPSAGIALAALLIYGRGLWPGVVVGSILVNLSVSLQSGAAWGGGQLVICTIIGVGAAAQALFGDWLTRSLLRRDPELMLLRSISGMLILGGPVACLINPTVGVGALVASGLIGKHAYLYSWMTWWVGDSMGVLVCLPLLLLWLGPPRPAWVSYRRIVALPLALFFSLSVLVFVLVNRQEQANLALEFQRNGEQIANSLDKQIARSHEAVLSIRSFFAASAIVTRKEFGAFVEGSLAARPMIRALSWDPLVLDAERSAVEAEARADGYPEFAITERDAAGALRVAGKRPVYVPVLYIEPSAQNREALGFDVYSQPQRRTALERARDEGSAVATGRLHLVQGEGDATGLLLFVPVYQTGHVPQSLAQRRVSLLGYAVGVLSFGDLLAGALHGLDVSDLAVRLYDDSNGSQLVAAHRPARPAGASQREPDAREAESMFAFTRRYHVAGRNWRLVLTSQDDYLATRHSVAGWGALVGCLLFTSLLGVFLLALTARRILDARLTRQLSAANSSLSEEVTRRKRIERALHAEKERAEVTLHSIGDAVITTDVTGCVEYLNPAAERLTEWSTEQARGLAIEEVFHVIDEETRRPLPSPVQQCLSTGIAVALTQQLVLRSRSGREYAIADSVAPIRDPSDALQGAVLVFHDVTETRRMARAAEYEATHDSLTGLVNRAEFLRRVDRGLASCKEYGRHHALCYLDLDQFKTINDMCGHRAGDELLKSVTAVLAHTVRDRDTLARLGGDEFGLLLENCPVGKAVEIARTLVALVREFRFVWEGKPFSVGLSIGLVPMAGQIDSAETLLAQADAACYGAKALGRNRVNVYQGEPSGADAHQRAVLRVTDIRTALDHDRFQLFSQPIWTMGSDPPVLTRHEVLVRMLDDAGALVQPGFFIPVAERFGLMDKIDRWVVQRTCRSYRSLFPGEDAPSLSINLSGNLLTQDKLLPLLHEELAQNEISPSKICFEITETAAIRNLSSAKSVMRELRQLGCKFALDDFGSGLSSFGYLKALPIDYLKIDGSLVRHIAHERVDRAMVEAINRLAHQMGMQTIAEYVESSECVHVLRELGVDHAQGYALGVPTPVCQPAAAALG